MCNFLPKGVPKGLPKGVPKGFLRLLEVFLGSSWRGFRVAPKSPGVLIWGSPEGVPKGVPDGVPKGFLWYCVGLPVS